MERKRKMPPRAAARSEHVAKRRNLTPRDRSETPATPQPPPPPKEPTPPPPPPPLPKSIQNGKPLPTVEVAQSEELSVKEYQSLGESGVLAESLSRSRNKWLHDGLFEKYWTKPHKRKGVLIEDPKNPPKDSMTKVGTVTITIEPHFIDATMYVVKDPKPRPQPQPPQLQQPQRPILQYGPPNGTMPKPPLPYQSSTSATPTPSVSAAQRPVSQSPAATPTAPVQPSPRPPSGPLVAPQINNARPVPPPMSNNMTPSPSPSYQARPNVAGAPVPPSATPPQVSRAPSNPPPPPSTHPIASPASAVPGSVPAPATPVAPMAAPATSGPMHPTPNAHTTQNSVLAPPRTPSSVAAPVLAPPAQAAPVAAPASTPTQPTAQTPGQAPAPAPASQTKPSPNDPVIALLAQKASGDPALRDLMKRVAVGQAKEGELKHFQSIIDQLNQEYRSRGGQQGPSADRLIVAGRTVKYFALEVRAITDVVLASNPNQKSADLRPPPRSDPLVVLLVKTAIEDMRTRDIIRRIADGRPGFTDATDLKEILDRLHRDMNPVPRASPAPSQMRQHTPNGMPNGQLQAPHAQPIQHNPQALRSKGPPPIPKPDISAVLFDFGSGDRYLFPKFSILEYLPTQSGQQVVASFLIVRKGSTSEYGGDPKLDYYEPITMRIFTQTGRHLENLSRVVAPQDEVRRYMDDVMDNMTRAEYVLLAMRLPRMIKDGERESGGSEEPNTNASTPKPEALPEPAPVAKPGVLWGPHSKSTTPARDVIRPIRDPEEESQRRYNRLINSIAAKDVDAV